MNQTLTIVVSDIFGRTQALESFAANLVDSTEIFDPYGGIDHKFANETEAYQFFTSQITLEKYVRDLHEYLSNTSGPVKLIGFSVGASAIWRLSNGCGGERCDYLQRIVQADCFYGSQIRNHTEIEPTFPVQLVFPAKESHFSVSELIKELSDKPRVTIEQTDYFHGFMNPCSNSFDDKGYEEFVRRLTTAKP